MNSSPIIIRILHRTNPGFVTNNDTQEELDIKNFSEDDIKSLRTADPFMYYSIPGVRKASMHLQDIDHSNTEALCNPEVQTSCSTFSRANKRPKRSTVITRRTGISYEAHPDALLEGLSNELEDLSEDEVKSLDCWESELFSLEK